jgi:hypothetical protein
MATLLWGSLITGSAFVVHLLIWRIRVPVRQTRALLLTFGSVMALTLGSLAAAPQVFPAHIPIPDALADYVHIALFVTACTAAYVITYSALEADSPTLVMVRAIAAAAPHGLEDEEFRARISDDVLVKPRLADLVRDGMLRLEDGCFWLTGKGRRLVNIFIVFRGILGAGKGG